MKQNLLKTMLFSTALMAGTMGAWADEATLNPTADTYLDWTNKTTNYGSATELQAGIWQEMWSDATPGLKGYTSNIVLMKFNVKEYAGKMTSVSLSVTGTNPSTNSNTRSIYLGYFDQTSWDESSVTAENSGMNARNAKTLNIHPFNLSVSIPKGKTQTCTFSSNDLLEYLNTKADADGNVSLIIYGVGQQCSVASKESETKPTLTIEYSAAQLYTATFTETTGVTPEVKVYSDESYTTEVSASALEASKTYYYVATAAGYEDYKGNFTVGEANPAVSFAMTKKETFAYSVNLVDGDGKVLKSVASVDNAYEGLAVNYTYPKYLTDETGKVTYVCTLTTFSGSATASKGNAPTIPYKAYNGTAYFVEAESAISATNLTNANYSSGVAVRGFSTEKDLITIPSAGLYRITYAVCSNNVNATRTLYLYNNDTQLVEKSVTWSVTYVGLTGTITESDAVSLAKGDVIKAKGSDTNIILDYILLEKVAETATVTDLAYASYVPSINVAVPADVKVYTGKVNDEKSAISLTALAEGTVIPAGTAVLVAGDEGTYTFNASTETATELADNELKAATAETAGDGSTIYALAKEDSKPVFALVKSGTAIGEGKAYIVIANTANANKSYSLGIGDGGTTGITEVSGAKVQADGDYYTLQGVKTAKPTSGIYIHNGKKVIVKK